MGVCVCTGGPAVGVWHANSSQHYWQANAWDHPWLQAGRFQAAGVWLAGCMHAGAPDMGTGNDSIHDNATRLHSSGEATPRCR